MDENKQGINVRQVLIAVVCVVAAAVLVLVLYGQYGRLQEARTTVNEERQALELAEARLARLEDLKEEEDVLRARAAFAEGLIPEQPSEDVLLNYLQAAANQSGIRFVQIRFQDRVQEERFVEMPLTMTFEGRYQELLSLLQKLRNGSRLVNVENVRIGQGQELFPQIRVEMAGRAFYKQAGAPVQIDGDDE